MNTPKDKIIPIIYRRQSDTHGAKQKGWIGVDLDGTLAEYHGWVNAEHIGAPIPKMVERVKAWLAEGKQVKIVTARVCPLTSPAEKHLSYYAIKRWLSVVFGQEAMDAIEITHEKNKAMIELWDDRAVQVIPNTGERADGKP